MSASRDEFPKAFVAGKLTEYQYEKFTPRIWTPIFSLFGITPKPGSFLLQYYCLIVESARDCIKAKEEEVLNYFINRHTNASAESFKSKIKGFKAQLHGVADIPFFMYRLCTIFG